MRLCKKESWLQLLKTFILLVIIILNLIILRRPKKINRYKEKHAYSFVVTWNDFPEMILAKYYKDNGYFLVLSDHNILSRVKNGCELIVLKRDAELLEFQP